jgi:hypothetical protein
VPYRGWGRLVSFAAGNTYADRITDGGSVKFVSGVFLDTMESVTFVIAPRAEVYPGPKG